MGQISKSTFNKILEMCRADRIVVDSDPGYGGGIFSKVSGWSTCYPVPTIWLNPNMKNIARLTAVLGHEYGHHKCGHVTEMWSPSPSDPDFQRYPLEQRLDVARCEVEATDFAWHLITPMTRSAEVRQKFRQMMAAKALLCAECGLTLHGYRQFMGADDWLGLPTRTAAKGL